MAIGEQDMLGIFSPNVKNSLRRLSSTGTLYPRVIIIKSKR